MSTRKQLEEAISAYELAISGIAKKLYYKHVRPFLEKHNLGLEVNLWHSYEFYKLDEEGSRVYVSNSIGEYDPGVEIMTWMDYVPVGFDCPLGALMPEKLA